MSAAVRCIKSPHAVPAGQYHRQSPTLAGHARRQYASVQPSKESSAPNTGFKIDLPKLNGHGPFAEKASFDVIGSPFSLLNARIPSKAVLYTRRGSLIGINGDVRHIGSTLSLFSSGVQGSIARALVGAPFLYQKIQSSEAFTALIGTRATATSFAVLELDGRFDWNIVTKHALLAWCGVTAQTRTQGLGPSLSRISTTLTGRGSAVLAGNGQIYQIILQQGESYIINPANILVYAESCPEPQRVKLPTVQLSLPTRMPSLGKFLLKYEFFRVMSAQPAWAVAKRVWHAVGRSFRNLVWGDQLLVRFEGPTTILVQSRTAARYSEERSPMELEPVVDSQKDDVQPVARTYSGSLKLASVENGQVILHDTERFVEK